MLKRISGDLAAEIRCDGEKPKLSREIMIKDSVFGGKDALTWLKMREKR